MADGTYERRGPREAELKRLQRILAEQARKREEAVVSGVGGSPEQKSQSTSRL